MMIQLIKKIAPVIILVNWKLILSYDGIIEVGKGGYNYIHDHMRAEVIRLYKIVEDPFEKNNLARENPEKVEQLKQKIEAWYPLKERKVLASSI